MSHLAFHIKQLLLHVHILEGEKRLQMSNTTRWNFQLIMIQSILCIPEDKLSSLKNVTDITAHERHILKDIVDILTPFQEVSEEQ